MSKKSKKAFQKTVPRWLFLVIYGSYAAMKNSYNLLIRYGLLKSSYTWKCKNHKGEPIPWFSYPAIEYLNNLDLSEMSVFEYGSGFSTIYWGNHVKQVIAIEHDSAWIEKTESKPSSNCQIIFCEQENYSNAINNSKDLYDIIVIDGINRIECAKAAVHKLRPGGFIILDDAEKLHTVATFLRQADLIEVDFAGFNPINAYTKTTSFFLHRDFQPVPKEGIMPIPSICCESKKQQL